MGFKEFFSNLFEAEKPKHPTNPYAECAASALPETKPNRPSIPDPILELEQHCHVEASHQLLFHNGKCKNLHGHSYDIQVKMEYYGGVIPTHNVVLDFGAIKDVCEKYDHQHLNNCEAFQNRSPTAENFCLVITRELYAVVDANYFSVRKITVRIREGLGSHWAQLVTQYQY